MNTVYDVPWAKSLLKSVGLRSTAARIAVLQRLAVAKRPLSHGEVVDKLREFGFDQSTIFRVLSELTESRVTTKLDLGDQVRRFELRSAPHGDEMEHPHFMCVDCGQVRCLSDFSVRLIPSRGNRRLRLGEITEVLLKGHCATCQAG